MSSDLQALRTEMAEIKALRARERSEMEAKHAAELELRARERCGMEANHAAELAEYEAVERELMAATLKEMEDSAAALRLLLASRAPPPPQEKPTMAFKLVSREALQKGEASIKDFKNFVGAHYKLALPLPLCDDEQKAEAYLTGRLREDGKLISHDVAHKLVLFRKTLEKLKGQLIVVVACGKEGKKHGGEVRRVVGDYTYDTSSLSLEYSRPYYHRFATEHVRKLTPEEFEKVMGQLGENPSSKYRLQWGIDI